MATHVLLRRVISKTVTPRSLPTTSTTTTILRIRPLISVVSSTLRHTITSHAFCTSSDDDQYSTRSTTCPPEEKRWLDASGFGCDFEHWLVVVEKPEGELSRDEIIESYINTLAKAVGISYDDARMKIYSVSTRCYYAFGALLSEEDSYKLKELPGVRWVLPDTYEDIKNKDYGGEPFIDGKAVPYDPKYHEKWIRDNEKLITYKQEKRDKRNKKK